MAAPFLTPQLAAALAERRFPTLTTWSRLEGRPRAENFERALAARCAMRCGCSAHGRWASFTATTPDRPCSPGSGSIAAASPATRRTHARSSLWDRRSLETQVERRPIPLARNSRELTLDLRLDMGRQWLKLLGTLPGLDLAAAIEQFKARYTVGAPDPTIPADAPTAPNQRCGAPSPPWPVGGSTAEPYTCI